MRNVSLVCLLTLAAAAAGACKPKSKGDTSDSASAAVAETSKPPIQCFDLAGARRLELMASQDGKTLAWLEVVNLDEGARFDLYSMGLDDSAPKKLAEDVETVEPAGKGRYLITREKKSKEYSFRKDKSLLVVDSTGKETLLLADEEKTESSKSLEYVSFAVDEAKDEVWVSFLLGDMVKAIPLAGGTGREVKLPTKVGSVFAFEADGKTALAGLSYRGGVCRIDLANPEKDCTPIGPSGQGYTLVEGGAIYLDDKTLKTTKLTGPLGDRATWAEEGDALVGSAPGKYALLARSKDKKASLLRATTSGAESIFSLAELEITSAQPVTGGHAILVRHPNKEREADVCVVRGTGELALTARQVGKAYTSSLPALQPILTGDLAGAKISSVPGKYPRIRFDSAASGPTDPAALRKRAEEVQKQVSAAIKLPNLGVELSWSGNKKEAVSIWMEGGDRFYLAGGDEDKLLYDKSQFQVELDPGSLFTYRESSGGTSGKRFGTYDCKGTVTNLSATPAKLEIECTVDAEFTGKQTKRNELKPSPLNSKSSAKFDFHVGIGSEDRGVSFAVYMDGKRVPYFNAFAERKALGQEK